MCFVLFLFLFLFLIVFFFHPIHYLRLSILSLLVVTQIRGHIAGSSPPLPTTVRYIFIARTYQLFLPSSTRVDCSMETSRIMRVDTRNYIIRVAVASQERVLVCITRNVILPENDMDLVLASKLTWLLCGRSK